MVLRFSKTGMTLTPTSLGGVLPATIGAETARVTRLGPVLPGELVRAAREPE